VTKPAPLFNRLALIGVGLIGSSIARAARSLGVVETIVATSRAEPTRRRIEQLGIVDKVVDTAAAAVAGADLVILCVPIGAFGAVARGSAPPRRSWERSI
jgi:cyclohexadieny/prephenate dehydrogenase